MLANFDSNKVPFKLIASHFIAGAISLIVSVILLLLNSDKISGHYFQPLWLSVVHMLILGFAITVIYGVSIQILPVMSNCKEVYARHCTFTFVSHIVGTLILVANFYAFNLNYIAIAGASLIVTGIISYNIFVLKVFLNAPQSLSTDFIKTSALWFLVSALFGLTLFLNLRFTFLPNEHLSYLPLHAGIGFIGWFLQLLIGVAQKLFPMFLVSNVPNNVLSNLNKTYWFLNISVAGLLVSSFFKNYHFVFLILFTCILALGLLYFIIFVYQSFKNRLRKGLDQGMKFTFVSILFLLIAIAFALSGLVNKIDLKKETGLIFLFGFIVPLLLGQSFKTFPFLKWVLLKNSYGLKFKLQPANLYNSKLLLFQNICYLTGLLLFIFNLFLKYKNITIISLLIMLLASVLYSVNIFSLSFKSYDYE